MSLPVILTSDMMGSPNLTPTNGSFNALLHACLVNGFNTQSVVSATASGGVVTFNFASAPGFSTLDTVSIAGASNAAVNGKFRVQSAAGNQVLVAITGVPDGAVGGTITLKFSPLGWTRPYSGANLGAYRQGGAATHKRFMRVYDGGFPAAGAYYMRGYENMTAISTGTGPFPTTAQAAGNGAQQYAVIDSTGDVPAAQHRAWVLMGTPRFFQIYMEAGRNMYGSSDTKTPLASVAQTAMFSLFFGDPANTPKATDTFACMCLNGAGTSGAYVPRKVSGAGTASLVSLIGHQHTFAFTSGLAYPSAADGGIHFAGPSVVYDSEPPYGMRGFFPGSVNPYEAPYSNSTTPPPIGHILNNVAGVTGRIMLLRSASTPWSDVGWLLDEDWGDL